MRRLDGGYDAIALNNVIRSFRTGRADVSHPDVTRLLTAFRVTPVFEGSRLRRGWERWALKQIAEDEASILNYRRVMLLCATERLSGAGLLAEYTNRLTFANPCWPAATTS